MKISATLFIVALGAGCSRISLIPGRTPLHEYRLEGKVIQISTNPDRALIEHKDIPGFMNAMTMTYRIPDPKEFAKIKVGDVITGTVFQRKFEDPFWLGKITVKAP